MRAYEVTAKNGSQTHGVRFGSTQADARAKRDELVEQFNVKKSSVTIDEVEIPTSKAELLEFINDMAAKSDAKE